MDNLSTTYGIMSDITVAAARLHLHLRGENHPPTYVSAARWRAILIWLRRNPPSSTKATRGISA
jgi:hypothetical protein